MTFSKVPVFPSDSIDTLSKLLPHVEISDVKVEASIEGESLLIELPQNFVLHEHIYLYLVKREKVLWVRKLYKNGVFSYRISLNLKDFLRYFCEHDIKRATFALFDGDEKEKRIVSYNLKIVSDAKTNPYDRSADYYPSLLETQFHQTPYPALSHQVDNETTLAITPYVRKNDGALSLMASWADEVPSNYLYGKLLSLSCNRAGKVTVCVQVPNVDFNCQGMELVYRSISDRVVHNLNTQLNQQDGQTLISSSFFPEQLGVREIYWDFFLILTKSGHRFRICVKVPKKTIHRFIVWGTHIKLSNGLIFFPYATTKAKRLAFTCRPVSKYDSFATRMYSLLAVILAPVVKKLIPHRNIWLIYEKFCTLAEDNGYYFFRYCMDSLTPAENKDIYYVIDKKSPAYANVKKYGFHVLNFMGFKHLLYTLLANLYVGSDSTQHLYQWRAMPNIIQTRMRKKDMLFLQHGVIAMKRVDKGFGANNSSPIKFFLTSSKAEQQIIVNYFGYAKHEVPVLGLSRWDVLEDRSNLKHPMILVMPTWRPWLEEQNMNVFIASEYFKAYSQLLCDNKLATILEQSDATINFFIHPKLGSFIEAFSTDSPRVHFVALGTRPLNELIMECSMLVTDYSSVCWDVLYQNKPVVYYQFDQQDFLKYVGAYLDFNTDLPGSVCKTVQESIEAIESVLKRDCKLLPENSVKAARWYIARDKNNRERTYQFIKQQGY
ncbi:CDP-glycerol glycerophosphotransferase family protein [uncultured Olegusella sp.]|uniref:CDP-glycerol glycerophosphotransferase family protein n=1 Tax=uncultured Olegusella sp. TaxID=1979846 RepID=UPI002637BCE6|nr:CDP-glycerol glycerophosphotransferase family protein [uncultured Olegusella sp.]